MNESLPVFSIDINKTVLITGEIETITRNCACGLVEEARSLGKPLEGDICPVCKEPVLDVVKFKNVTTLGNVD